MRKTKSVPRKFFVLDTNVLMHDPTAMFRFEEHDVCIPMVVLEELDNHKKGNTEIARNVRQAMRFLDELVKIPGAIYADGIPLSGSVDRSATGRIYFVTDEELSVSKADNIIINTVRKLQESKHGRPVILVSKDINMRIKAGALAILAEDYENDNVLEDSDLIYSGLRRLSYEEYERLISKSRSYHVEQRTHYEVRRASSKLTRSLSINEAIVYPDHDEKTKVLLVDSVSDGKVVLRTIDNYMGTKHDVFGVTARNIEQNVALNFLMDPEIHIVTLLGQAGTGKTLMALAAGLKGTEENHYHQIIMTRATVPVGEDIGYLPGTEEEKMNPWMGALQDNLDVLGMLSRGKSADKKHEVDNGWNNSAMTEFMRTRISVRSLSFMRGRTFLKKFVIIDEAQNLSAKQMKTLITRAGPGTKVVCMGNIAQIDTPYLTEGNSGITHTVARFKGWKHSGHVTLAQCERSPLAEYASQVM